MFEHAETTLKLYSKINFVCGILLAIVTVFVGIASEEDLTLLWIGIGAVIVLGAFLVSCLIYGFADLLEHTKKIHQILNIHCMAELDSYYDAQAKAQQEQVRREEQARQAAEAQRRQEEAAKQARIDAYWASHAAEKEALLKKRAAVLEKLNGMSTLAGKQRTELWDLIHAIDEELTKDRRDIPYGQE